MLIHRSTVPPSFERGAAPDDQQLSPYASFARPLLVAASHNLQNDSQPCYNPLLAVYSSGQGNSFSDLRVSRLESETFATFRASFSKLVIYFVFYLQARYELNFDLPYNATRQSSLSSIELTLPELIRRQHIKILYAETSSC
ncbi:hypothetical protein C8F01DRAFT_1366886 [Mycena amicta]|nr:hypothetical protein C8F01DRAFT_1366886 [Mycena amicta]